MLSLLVAHPSLLRSMLTTEGMSDPDFVKRTGCATTAAKEEDLPLELQEESDAMYARQLAEHYYDSSYDGFGTPVRGDPADGREKSDKIP